MILSTFFLSLISFLFAAANANSLLVFKKNKKKNVRLIICSALSLLWLYVVFSITASFALKELNVLYVLIIPILIWFISFYDVYSEKNYIFKFLSNIHHITDPLLRLLERLFTGTGLILGVALIILVVILIIFLIIKSIKFIWYF